MPCFHTSTAVIVTLVMMRDSTTASCDNRMSISVSLNLLIENAVQYCFLGKPIDVTRGLRLLRQNHSSSSNRAVMLMIVHLREKMLLLLRHLLLHTRWRVILPRSIRSFADLTRSRLSNVRNTAANGAISHDSQATYGIRIIVI